MECYSSNIQCPPQAPGSSAWSPILLKVPEDTATPAVRAEPGLGQVPGPLQKPTASDPAR